MHAAQPTLRTSLRNFATLSTVLFLALQLAAPSHAQSGTWQGNRSYEVNQAPSDYRPPAQAPQYPDYNRSNAGCRDCATVENIREVKNEGQGTGLGAIGGAVVGGVLGNQVGSGRGKTVGAVVGAAGGAYAGNEIEKRARGNSSYEITVRMDEGGTRVFEYAEAPPWRRGDRVRVNNGRLERLY